LSIELDRPNDNLLNATFTIAPSNFEEALRIVKIIAGEIDPQWHGSCSIKQTLNVRGELMRRTIGHALRYGTVALPSPNQALNSDLFHHAARTEKLLPRRLAGSSVDLI
jgi:hypothetical protein